MSIGKLIGKYFKGYANYMTLGLYGYYTRINKAKTRGNDPQSISTIRIQSSAYGGAIPIVYGKSRISGNVIWYSDFRTSYWPAGETVANGNAGKGGGGGQSQPDPVTYRASIMLALCEGTITDISNVWADKEQKTLAASGFALYAGNYSQTPWPHLTTFHAINALSYRGIAYLVDEFQVLPNASLQNYTFEVGGLLQYGSGIVDANPSAIINDLLTNVNYGLGFPSGKIGDLTGYSNYCIAAGIFFSPSLITQRAAYTIIDDLSTTSNAAIVWSEGKIKIIPFQDTVVTGNSVTYTPNTTPVYDLTDGDFVASTSEDPITVNRNATADAFNHVQVEFINRAEQYNVEIAEAKDQANIELYGLRSDKPIQMHHICDASVARMIAQLTLQRAVYARNQYQFKLGIKYCLLEPMDLVTITDSALGFNLKPVRIVSIEEDADLYLNIIAEDFLAGAASATLYPTQQGSGGGLNFNATPGNVNAPVLFEPPDLLASTGLEVWAAVSGGANWGGCDVYISSDGSSYRKVGRVLGPARHGSLSATLATGTSPDSTHTLSVDMTPSNGSLLSVSQADANSLNTLSYVDGELIAYQTATLTATAKYDLTYLVRGAYGTTIRAHNAGTSYARLDSQIFKYPFTSDLIGKPIYIKFLSFNKWGGAQQQLSDVLAFQYNVTGTALTSPLPNVLNLVSYFDNGQTYLSWDAVTDFRKLNYEVRKGSTFSKSQILGLVPITDFATDGDGVYWVTAHSDLAYSATPAQISISGSILTKNVVATYDEKVTGWSGTLTGLTNVSAVLQTALGTAGNYEIPAGHIVDIGTPQACNCSVNYSFYADNPNTLFSTVPLVSALTSVAGNYAGHATIKIQIALSQNGTTWSAWQDFVVGQYVARAFKFRAVVTPLNSSVVGVLQSFAFTVDMPDRIDKGTGISLLAAGATITYSTPFQVAPNVQITILSATANDDVILTAQTKTGFTVQVVNGGAGVARTINWLSQGY